MLQDTYVLCRVTKRDGFVVGEKDPKPQCKHIDDQNVVEDLDSSRPAVVQQNESSPSEGAEDIELWLKELLDPNFDGSIEFGPLTELPSIEPTKELQVWSIFLLLL